MTYMPIARIVLRYLAGALVAYGLISEDVAQQIALDSDLAIVVGAAIGAIVEAVYTYAKRNGGAT